MDYFTNKRVLIVVIAVLVILNLGSLATLWIMRNPPRQSGISEIPPPPPPPPPPPLDLQAVMASELHLSDHQKVRIQHATERFVRRSEELLRVYHADKRRLLEELAADRPDSARMGHLTGLLGRQHTELERIMVDYFLELRQIYSPQQAKHFHAVIDQVIHRISPNNLNP